MFWAVGDFESLKSAMDQQYCLLGEQLPLLISS